MLSARGIVSESQSATRAFAASTPDSHYLQRNYDVRIAATRILQAQAQVGITRADQLDDQRRSSGRQSTLRAPKFSPQFEKSAHHADLSLALELDFWASRAKIIGSGHRARRCFVPEFVGELYGNPDGPSRLGAVLIDLTQLEHPELFAGGGTQPARHCHHQRRGKQHTRLEHS